MQCMNGSTARRRCCASTTASIWSRPWPGWSHRCSPRCARCGCSPPASSPRRRRRGGVRPRTAVTPRIRSRSSPPGQPVRGAGFTLEGRHARRGRGTSAEPSTDSRWPSSSRPPECGRFRFSTSSEGSTTDSPCCAIRAVTCQSDAEPWSAAIGWSYDLLFPDDQRGLWALSCFVGGASLAAIEHVMIALDVADHRPRRHHHPARRPIAGGGRRRPPTAPCDTGCSTASACTPLSGCMTPARDTSPRAPTPTGSWSAPPGATPTSGARNRHACVAFALAERANIDAALAWCRVHDPALRGAVGGGPGVDVGRAR